MRVLLVAHIRPPLDDGYRVNVGCTLTHHAKSMPRSSRQSDEEDILAIVKRRKLQWYGHVSRSQGLTKTVLQGTVKGGSGQLQTEEEVGRQHQGIDMPGVRLVPEDTGEQRKMEETDCEFICSAPTILVVKG